MWEGTFRIAKFLSRASDAAFADSRSEDGDGQLTDLEQIIRSALQPYGYRCEAALCA